LATFYYMPANIEEITFRNNDGSLFTGRVSSLAVRTFDNHKFYWIDPATGMIAPNFEITNGQIETGAVNAICYTTTQGFVVRWDGLCFYRADTGQKSITPALTSSDSRPGLGDITEYIIPLPQGFSVVVDISVTPASPYPLSLIVDDEIQTTGTSVLSYSGDASYWSVMLGEDVLFNKPVTASGTYNVNLAMTSQEKQIDLSQFDIADGSITNRGGRLLPKISVYGM